jgi:hypothetical protein
VNGLCGTNFGKIIRLPKPVFLVVLWFGINEKFCHKSIFLGLVAELALKCFRHKSVFLGTCGGIFIY